MQIDLSQKSMIELKAIAYDLIAQLELVKKDLATVNNLVLQKINEENSRINIGDKIPIKE